MADGGIRAIREVVVLTDDPGTNNGLVLGTALRLDGHEWAVPGDATVKAEIGSHAGPALQVTVTFFASTVRFEHQKEPSDG